MSYPGPPGVPSAHPSLPPRPPAVAKQQQPTGPSTTSKFSSTFSRPGASYSAGPTAYPTTTSYSAAPTYGTTAAPPAHYGAAPTTYSSYSQPSTVRTGGGYGQGGYSNTTNSGGAYSSSYNTYSAPAGPTYPGAAPQIRNPFPLPGTAGATSEDAEMAAQIAQWQSAYMPKADGDPTSAASLGHRAPGTTDNTQQQQQQQSQYGAGDAVVDSNERKKTVYRAGGGKKWTDDTLVEWDPTHLRLFVGNLAGETTDESLLKAFSRWKSVQKSKVIRDKRTNKSKGYGFVSFSDPDDFFQAAKEMNGKYIQSHPVTVKKATTEIKVTNAKDDRRGNGKKDGKKKGGNGNGNGKGGGAYEPHLGPAHPGGVVKPGQKTKGGLKLLG